MRRHRYSACRDCSPCKGLSVPSVIQIERKVVSRHHPIQGRRYKTRKRYLGRGYLPLQLFGRPAFPCVHEWRKIVFQFRIGRKNRKYVFISLVEQFYHMRKGAVPAVLVDFQIPDDCCEECDGAFGKEVAPVSPSTSGSGFSITV